VGGVGAAPWFARYTWGNGCYRGSICWTGLGWVGDAAGDDGMLYCSTTMETDLWRIWLDCFFLPSRGSKLDDAEWKATRKSCQSPRFLHLCAGKS
jgi:hypothetical protein